jgi:hypothetical protein
VERVSSLTAALAALAFASGCTGSKFWTKETTMAPQGVPSAPLSPQVRGDSGVVQASATTPAGSTSWSLPGSLAKLTGKTERKAPAAEIITMWRNRVDSLPDPSREGQMSPGLAGQLFLYDARMQPVVAEGSLTVALYDETPRPPGQPANLPEGWEFKKADLKKLVTMDERFGRSYTLFLPWPTYRPDVTRIRIAVRFDQENGHPLYAAETRITIDTSAPGSTQPVEWTNQLVPAVGPNEFSPLGGPPPSASPIFGMPPPNRPAAGALPAGFGNLEPAPASFGALPTVPPGALAPPGGGTGAGPAVPAVPAVPYDPNGLLPVGATIPRR